MLKKYFLLLIILLTSSFMMQSFQCTSPTMSSAKTAYQARDYQTAVKYLNEEIAKNPTNADAYLLRGEIYMYTGNFKQAAEDLAKAQKHSTTEMTKSKASQFIYKIWTNSYNQGLHQISKYYNTNQEVHLDSALYFFDIGQSIRPEISDFSYYKATVYEMQGDTTNALKDYQAYVDQLSDEMDFAKVNNIFLNYPISKFNTTFGAPADTRQTIMQDSSIVTSSLYKIDGKDVYVFAQTSKANPDPKIIGWRIGTPANWSSAEVFQYQKFNLSPYKAIAQIQYSNLNNKKAAIEALEKVLVLDPTDKDANSSIIQLYQEIGQLDVALQKLEQKLKDNPNNKNFWAQYGDIQMNLEKYDDAIEKYQKALEIDPNYDLVLRNIASAFKNKASIIQKQQAEKMEADKKYKPEPEKYFPQLRKSAEYFEKALKTQRFQNNFVVLGELGNIYTVLEEKDKLNKVLQNLEGIEYSIDDEDKEAYYLLMIQLYSNNQMNDKSEVIEAKYNALTK